MKFSVPTNWQDNLVPRIKRNDVDELYGKLARDFVGGGRPSFILPSVSKKQAAAHIKEAHKNNLKFNYLLNSLCLDNVELVSNGIFRYLYEDGE